METYEIFHIWQERWDGSDETAGEFGFGDYRKNHLDLVATVTAETVRGAQAQGRQVFKSLGLGKARFSGVGATAYIKPSK